MKKLAILVAVAGFVLAAPMALAGDYHQGLNLVCSDCHTMHYSESHTYGDSDPLLTGTGGPFPKLLRYEQNDLCLSCHDGSALAPDVLGANTSSYVREAGALNKSDGTGDYAPGHGHSLGTVGNPPGGTWASGQDDQLTCGDCHSTHGATTYRNLKRNPNGSASNYITWAVGTNNTAKDVFEINGHGSTLAQHYGVDNVWFNEPDQTGSKYATFCKGCHTDFHGNSSNANMYDMADSSWVRHPTAGVDLSSSYASRWFAYANRVKVLGVDNTLAAAPTTATPSCMTCHKAHGNKNPFGLIFMAGTGTVTEEGDTDGTGIRNLCRQCHSQGTP